MDSLRPQPPQLGGEPRLGEEERSETAAANCAAAATWLKSPSATTTTSLAHSNVSPERERASVATEPVSMGLL